MTALPILNGRSSAEQFMEEHDRLVHELELAQDEIASYKEQVVQTTNMVGLLQAENAHIREELRRERVRANTWLAYTMKMTGQLQTIEGTVAAAKMIAHEAAKAASERRLDEAEEPEEAREADAKKLTAIIAEQPSRVPEAMGGLPTNVYS